jgi:hypothetical protein
MNSSTTNINSTNNPREADPTEDRSRTAFHLVVAGVASGLPVPGRINISANNRYLEVWVGDDNEAGAIAWAAHLGLPAPTLEAGLLGGGGRRNFQTFKVCTYDYPALPGWLVEVTSYITVPAATDEQDQAEGVAR